MFVLARKALWVGMEYYTGKTFIREREIYPVVTKNKQEARKYKSQATAKNTCTKLNLKVSGEFIVECLNLE